MVMGSDLKRDGMFLELLVDGRSVDPPLEMFYSDATGTFTLNTLQTASIPLEIVEHFIREAQRCLPPAKQDTPDVATPPI